MSQNLRRTVIQMAKQGQTKAALNLVRDHVKQHPNDVDGWWLLANMVKNPEIQRRCLEKIIELDPDHTKARQKLSQLTASGTSQAAKEAPTKSMPAAPARSQTPPPPSPADEQPLTLTTMRDVPEPSVEDFFEGGDPFADLDVPDEASVTDVPPESKTPIKKAQSIKATSPAGSSENPFAVPVEENPFAGEPTAPPSSKTSSATVEENPFATLEADDNPFASSTPAQPAPSPAVDDDLLAGLMDDDWDDMSHGPAQETKKAAENPFARTDPAAKAKPKTADGKATPNEDIVPFDFKLAQERKLKKQAAQAGLSKQQSYMLVGGLVLAMIIILGVAIYYVTGSDDLELNATASNNVVSIDYPDNWFEDQHAEERIVLTSRRIPTSAINPWRFMSDGINGQYPALAFFDFVSQPILAADGQELQAVVVQPVPQTPQYLIDIMIQQVEEIYNSNLNVPSNASVEIESEKSSFEIDGEQAEFTVMDVTFSETGLFSNRDEVHVGLYFAVTQQNGQHYLYTMLVFEENPLDWRDNARQIAESIDLKPVS